MIKGTSRSLNNFKVPALKPDNSHSDFLAIDTSTKASKTSFSKQKSIQKFESNEDDHRESMEDDVLENDSFIAKSDMSEDAINVLREITDEFNMSYFDIKKSRQLKEEPLINYDRDELKNMITVQRQKKKRSQKEGKQKVNNQSK